MNKKQSVALGLLITITSFLVLVLTANDVGITWDEPIYIETSMRAIHWIGLLLHGEFQQAFEPVTFGVSWGLNAEHPPLMRLVWGLGWIITRSLFSAPLTHRIGAIAFASVGLGGIAILIARERGVRVAIFTILAILTMPRAFFHAHLTTLDFSLAVMWVLTSLIFYRLLKISRAEQGFLSLLKGSAIIGILLGLALLTKINAILLLPFWTLWLLWRQRSWRNMIMWMLSLPVAVITVIVGWPWKWNNVLGGLLAWGDFFRIHYSIPQWFAGELYVDTPTWFGPVVTLLITIPSLLLALAAAGAWRRNKAEDSLRDWIDFNLLGMIIVLVFFALPGSHWHDSDRMLLPASFHLAILSAEGFDFIVSRLSSFLNRQSDWQRIIWQVGLGLILLFPGIMGIVQLHPYELAYYNGLILGPKGAEKLGFETIYFASTYNAFLPELNALPDGSKVWVMPNSYDVLYYYQLNGLLRSDLSMLRPPGWGSFYDDMGVNYAEGWIDNADAAIIERRQTDYNNILPNHDRIIWWAENAPEQARLERKGVILSTFHTKP